MNDMTCSRCRQPGAIFKFYTDSGELVCTHCQQVEKEHGPSVPRLILSALCVLSKRRKDRVSALRAKAESLIAHDRILAGAAR